MQNETNAIRFRHEGDIQVITSTGSIAERISKRLPEIIMTERGMTALQKANQMTDEAMILLDDEATMFLVSHWAKFYTHHWYTASRKYKFGQVDSAECKCCSDVVQETTAHIIQCPDRNEVHIEHRQKLTELLANQQLPNGLLYLIEAGIDPALQSDNTHQGEAWDGYDEGNNEEKRVAQLLNNNEINMEYKEAF